MIRVLRSQLNRYRIQNDVVCKLLHDAISVIRIIS